MESVLLAASLIMAAAPTSASAGEPVNASALDHSCLRLMADLAENEDPGIQDLGRVAAQYFLGRIDAAEPGFDLEAALAGEAPAGADREILLGQCGDAMQAGGHDFRNIGRALAPAGAPRA